MRAPSGCSKDNAALTKAVRPIHAVSREIYCALRVHAEFVAEGIPARGNRVACVMREANIAGVSRCKFVMPTVRDSKHQATDLVDPAFTADAPNVPWMADITYIPTSRVLLYLAVVLDALSMALRPTALAGAHCARP